MYVNKVFITAAITLSLSVIASAAKAYIDVTELKVKVEGFKENQTDIKRDVREIKTDIKTLLERIPKEG